MSGKSLIDIGWNNYKENNRKSAKGLEDKQAYFFLTNLKL